MRSRGDGRSPGVGPARNDPDDPILPEATAHPTGTAAPARSAHPASRADQAEDFFGQDSASMRAARYSPISTRPRSQTRYTTW